MAKYLDDSGVSQLWTAVKEQDATNLTAAKNYTDGKDNAMGGRVSTLEGYFTNGVANEAAKATKDGDNNTISSTYVKVSTKGAANGVASLDSTGKIPAAQLPSFVDDVIEGYYYQNKFYAESAHTTEITGEGGKIYVDLTTLNTYRWSGSAWVMISESLAVGTTAGTAYDGAAGATMRSDVDALQTAVSTTIPATYVPITNTYISGNSTYKNDITRAVGMLLLQSYVDNSYRGLVRLSNNGVLIRNSTGNTINTEINMESSSNLVFMASDLKWRKSISDLQGTTLATVDDVKVDTIKINGTALTPSNKAVDIITNTAYNASTNKLATMADIPSVQAITSQELAAILV